LNPRVSFNFHRIFYELSKPNLGFNVPNHEHNIGFLAVSLLVSGDFVFLYAITDILGFCYRLSDCFYSSVSYELNPETIIISNI